MNKIRVCILDDDLIYGLAMGKRLDGTDRFQCAGVFHSAREGIREILRIGPEVVLLDLKMKKLSGVGCAVWLRERMPGLRIVMLTSHTRARLILEAFRAGAIGYADKGRPDSELLQAMDKALAGEFALTPNVAREFLRYFDECSVTKPSSLTPREQEILVKLSHGATRAEIADELEITERAVEHHVNSVFAKLSLSSAGLKRLILNGVGEAGGVAYLRMLQNLVGSVKG